jgi:hypothetical protein
MFLIYISHSISFAFSFLKIFFCIYVNGRHVSAHFSKILKIFSHFSYSSNFSLECFILPYGCFASYNNPFRSLFFPSPSLPQSYFEMLPLCSLSYFEFFYFFRCFFVHYSVIYHCFPPAPYVCPFPFFVPLFIPTSHPFSSIHSIFSPLHFPPCF